MRPAARAAQEIWFQKARNMKGYPRISKDIPCIYVKWCNIMYILGWYTWYIRGYTMYIHSDGCTWYIHQYTRYIPCICRRTPYIWNIPVIYQEYTRHRKLGFQMLVGCTLKRWNTLSVAAFHFRLWPLPQFSKSWGILWILGLPVSSAAWKWEQSLFQVQGTLHEICSLSGWLVRIWIGGY